MNKALFSNYFDEIVNEITSKYSIVDSTTVDSVLYPWIELEYHLIFDEGVSNNLVVQTCSRLLDNTILPYYKFFDKENVMNTNVSPEAVDTRTVSVDVNTASEAQPINNLITSITSPTSKGAKVASGTDTNSRSSITDELKYYDYLKEVKSFGYQLRKVLAPMIEELNVMY